MQRILIIILFCYLGYYNIVNAQSLSIKNVSLRPNDKTAFLSPCLDSNGDTCALIKIKVPNVEGIEFPYKNQYVKSTYTDGFYYVYMPTISRRLDYRHSNYLPGQIDLGEYGYKRLKAGMTYVVYMETPSNIKAESLLILKVTPVGARLLFNGARISLSTTGIYEFPLREGIYSYSVIMDNFAPIDGTIKVGNDENKSVAIDLKPIMHSVKVNCNVDDAHVFVDNVDYGEVGILNLPQGNHTIRIQGDGYLDVEENVIIDNNMSSLSYFLKKNRNIKEIHATPVRIYSSSSKVYKNNKEIRDWKKSGDVVLIMPGKYEISDIEGNINRIVVGKDSMVVILGSSAKVIKASVTHEYVDLNLPSGTLWATMNIGANCCEENGTFFEWGGTIGGDEGNPCYNRNISIKRTRFDAATILWGKDWSMPTVNQAEELLNYCSISTTSINGHSVVKVTGSNGNSIYFPQEINKGKKHYENTLAYWTCEPTIYFSYSYLGAKYFRVVQGASLSKEGMHKRSRLQVRAVYNKTNKKK